MDKVKRYIPYLLLTGLTLFFCRMFVGRYGIFGAKVDWLSQHSVLPEYFRQQFYATGKLFPEFAANIGGGQNIYHFAYYGLYSPLLLPSYLLPFVKMSDYIMSVSVIGLAASVLLFYGWLKSRRIGGDICFGAAVIFLLAGPVIGQYSGQIMFVDYMPFLCLALMGVDRCFDQGKSGLYTISVFCMIMTSFYFSIGGMLALVLYGMHRYFQKKEGQKITIVKFLMDGIQFVCPMILAVLLSGFYLVPTALALTGERNSGHKLSPAMLFLPQLPVERLVYSIYGIGLTTLVITVLITGLLYKKRNERVLSYGCVLILVIPVFAYLLNGGLYIRDKVFIPFLPILCYLIALYLEKCREGELSLLSGAVPYVLTTGIIYIDRNQFTKVELWKMLMAESIVLLICYLIFYLLKKFKIREGKQQREKDREILLLILPSVLCLVLMMNLFYQYKSDRYVSRQMYRKVTGKETGRAVKSMIKKDQGYYRIEQIGNDEENAANLNRIWDKDQMITSIYSSAYNADYQKFRQETFGIEEPYRNVMMQSVSKNPVFQRMMGVRYVVSDKAVPGYKLIKKYGKNGIYQKQSCAPVAYATNHVMAVTEYRKLSYPYKQSAFLEYAVVDDPNDQRENGADSKENMLTSYVPVSLKADGTNNKYGRHIQEESDGYKIRSKKKRNVKLLIQNIDGTGTADESAQGKAGNREKVDSEENVLFLRCQVKNNHPNKDVTVWVNGIRNKLTARDHIYYNGNETFTYAIPLKADVDYVNVTFSKGNYCLRNIQAYMGTLPEKSDKLYQSEFERDKRQTQDNRIQGTIDVKNPGWFITSIPYDSHFQIYVDGKERKTEKVNMAFLGCRIGKGKHEVKIRYHAPGVKAGRCLSGIGILMIAVFTWRKIICFLKRTGKCKLVFKS